MNLILFRGSGGAARRYELSASFTAILGILILAFISVGFGGGYLYGHAAAEQEPIAEVVELKAQVADQHQVLAQARGAAQEQIDALALRLGELNAGVIRLNALGRRLTGMADLDAEEFDFDSAPALGGPEEPAVMSAAGGVPDLLADLDAMDRTLFTQRQQLTVLEGLMMNRKLYQRVYPKGRPVRSGYLSSYFGKRTDPFSGKSAWHRGVDFAGKAGGDVIAVAAGVVTWSGDRYGYGKMVEINHGNGYVTRYAHNSQNLVTVGDNVQPGQTIALIGSTGRATGPNLHFEVWYRGRPVNPVKHIRQTT